MIKKLCVVLLFATILANSLFSQEEERESEEKWYFSFAPGIAEKTVFANAGIGFSNLPYKAKMPTISASVDLNLLKTVPVTFGAYFSYVGYDESLIDGLYGDLLKDYKIYYRGDLITFAGRASYHFNFLKNLDVYAGISPGYIIYNQKVGNEKYEYSVGEYKTEIPATEIKHNFNTGFFGFHAGVRYYFTDFLGAFAEFDYNPFSWARIGITLKF